MMKYFHVEITQPDPDNNNMGCDNQDSSSRLFELTGMNAHESKCRLECSENDECEAVSGIWKSMCIGCKSPLSVKYEGAQAFRKGMIYSLKAVRRFRCL